MRRNQRKPAFFRNGFVPIWVNTSEKYVENTYEIHEKHLQASNKWQLRIFYLKCIFFQKSNLKFICLSNLLQFLDGPRMSFHDDEVLGKKTLSFKIALKPTTWEKVK